MCFIVKQRDEQTAAGKFVMDSGHGNIVNIPILANMVQNPNTIWQQPFKHQPTTSNHGDVIQITASPADRAPFPWLWQPSGLHASLGPM